MSKAKKRKVEEEVKDFCLFTARDIFGLIYSYRVKNLESV